MEHRGITISADLYLKKLWEDIDGYLATLRSTLRSLEDETFWIKSRQQSPNVVSHLQLRDLRKAEDIKKAALRQCFSDMVSSLVDFIDSLIAISNIVSQPVYLTRNLYSLQEVEDYILEKLGQDIQDIAQNTKLTKPKKLKRFQGISAFSAQAVNGYFAIRNSIEHHKSLMSRNATFLTRAFKGIVDGEEITNLPYAFQAGQVIEVKAVNDRRVIQKGDEITFAEQELDNLALSIKHVIAPDLQKMIAKRGAHTGAS